MNDEKIKFNSNCSYSHTYIVKNSGVFRTRSEARKIRNLIITSERAKTVIKKCTLADDKGKPYWVICYRDLEDN